jgi:hypothetical protein
MRWRKHKSILIIVGILAAATFAGMVSAMPRSILKTSQILYQGEFLQSPNGKFKLVLQTDGNLVLYEGEKALWSSETNGKNVKKLVMQSDGNLVLYSPNGPVWATNTSGNPGAYLVLQDDGNLVIYRAIWSTGTAQ